MLSEKTNAHSEFIISVAFSPDGTKIVSRSADDFSDGTIKVWDADLFNLLETRPGEAMAFSKEVEGVVQDGATIRMKEGGGAFYAPSLIRCVAVSWPRIAAGAQSGELYHLEVMM
jgi:WD40 repeat protein